MWSIHSFIPNTKPNYKDMLAMLITAKTTGQPIDVWYDSQSSQYSCTSSGTLLPVYSVGFR